MSESGVSPSKWLLRSLIFSQILLLVFIYLGTRTPLMWVLSIVSFLPATFICLYTKEKRFVLSSLILFFVSQQAILVFANPSWGFTFGSDQINDFQTASVMAESSSFELGKLGYTNRMSYSYYPMLHLFSNAFSKISGLPLMTVALYFVPLLSTVLTTFALFLFNGDFFNLSWQQRNLATLFFQLSFYYTSFDSQFVREAFAFPLAILAFWVFSRVTKSQNRSLSILAFLAIVVVVMSHQITSLLLLTVFFFMYLGYRFYQKNNNLAHLLFLAAVVFAMYTFYVAFSLSEVTLSLTIEGIQSILSSGGSSTVLSSASSSSVLLAYLQYGLLALFSLVGVLAVLFKRKRGVAVPLLLFLSFGFVVSVFLRLAVSADPWDWVYYMALRGTIWAFLGISVLATVGVVFLLRVTENSKKGWVILLVLVAILAAGKFAQFSPIVTEQSGTPITYSRFVASIWLKDVTVHGSNLLVAYDNETMAFETAREMAPYAYLREYFLDDGKGIVYEHFSGYVPFVGDFYGQYEGLPDVSVTYNNGDTPIGYRAP